MTSLKTQPNGILIHPYLVKMAVILGKSRRKSEILMQETGGWNLAILAWNIPHSFPIVNNCISYLKQIPSSNFWYDEIACDGYQFIGAVNINYRIIIIVMSLLHYRIIAYPIQMYRILWWFKWPQHKIFFIWIRINLLAVPTWSYNLVNPSVL